ncbi:DgyrCDS7235 [Dimorphilus gyrociliatus]|nr:DgyrCDS7235 [Dimorphilus gyrociliatus]
MVHVDMDMFYAAVEMRDDPSLREKAMAVGGNSMLSTSNYIARRFGVRAGMPGFIAKKLCQDLTIIRPHFFKYKAVSKQVQKVFATYDPNFSMMSLDEGYLDFTSHMQWRRESEDSERTVPVVWRSEEMCFCEKYCPKYVYDENQGQEEIPEKNEDISSSPDLFDEDDSNEENIKASGENLPDFCENCEKRIFKTAPFDAVLFGLDINEAVKEMRFRIEQSTHLTASAGIAPNTLLSKVCSDMNKPNGQYRVLPTREDVINFIDELPIRKISGIGKVCEKMLSGMEIKYCQDLFKKRGELQLISSDISFRYYMKISLGIGSTFVSSHGERKSMSVERTFREMTDRDEMYKKCLDLCNELGGDLKRHNLVGKTITLKIKKSDFSVKTKAQTIANFTDDYELIFKTAYDLLETEIMNSKLLKLRLMGVRMSTLQESSKITSKQNDIKGFLTNMKKKVAKRSAEKPDLIKKGLKRDAEKRETINIKRRASNNLKDMFAKIKETRKVEADDEDDIIVVYEKITDKK